MATGNNPGERERRRWAAVQLQGKRYQPGTPRDEVHLDLRASPRIGLLNLCLSPETYTEHAPCQECADIIAAAGRGESTLTEQQWQEFHSRWKGEPGGDR